MKSVLDTLEELKAVLKNGIDSASRSLASNSAPISDLEVPANILQTEDKSIPYEIEKGNELSEKEKLENEKLKAEIRHLEAKTRNENIKQFHFLSELLAKGIIEPDMVKIDISDLLIVFKTNRDINTGNIDEVIS